MKFFTALTWASCYNCGQSWHYLCPLCIPTLNIYDWFDYVSKQASSNFFVDKKYLDNFPIEQVVVLTHYHQKWVRKLLRHAKFYGKHQAYRDIIIPYWDFFRKYIENQNTVFIPVPLHFFRKWKRGFNQSEKIAKILSSITGIETHNTLLYRKKYTIHQSKLSKSERQVMLQNAFYISKSISNISKDTVIYLIDDVISSWSTLIECAKTLRIAGFTQVRAVVLASD